MQSLLTALVVMCSCCVLLLSAAIVVVLCWPAVVVVLAGMDVAHSKKLIKCISKLAKQRNNKKIKHTYVEKDK